MKEKAWLKYLIYICLILLIQILLIFVFHNIIIFIYHQSVILIAPYPLLISIIFITAGILLGLEHFVSALKKEGRWRINLPKILLMGIPALYFCTGYGLTSKISLSESTFFQPVIQFLIRSEMFISIFQLLLGYSIITSFYRHNRKGSSQKAKSWMKYLAYSLIILVIQLLGGALFPTDVLIDKVHLADIEMFIFYAALGLILGMEYLINEARKEGIWKINLPKIAFMGIPSLSFSIYYFISTWSSQFTKNVKDYASHVFINYPPAVYYVPVVHLILGYSITTSLYKCNCEAYGESCINSAVTKIETLIKKFIGKIKRCPGRASLVITCTILCLSLLVNSTFYRKIEDIAGANFDNITSIDLSYRGIITDPKAIKEFTDMLRKSVLRKMVYKYDIKGYFLTEPPLVVVFYSNDKQLFNMYFKGKYMTITNSRTEYSVEYEIMKDSISIEELERLVDSWN